MKKMYYGIYDGRVEAHRMDGSERFVITVSSEAETAQDALESITGETTGNCFGPSDAPEWTENFLMENFNNFEEMDSEEEDERLGHLAEEWGLCPEDLDYLR